MFHSFIHSFLHSFLPFFIHSFLPSFIHSFLHSFIPSFIHSFVHYFDFLRSPNFFRSLRCKNNFSWERLGSYFDDMFYFYFFSEFVKYLFGSSSPAIFGRNLLNAISRGNWNIFGRYLPRNIWKQVLLRVLRVPCSDLGSANTGNNKKKGSQP